jgi:hypothetical protein
LYIAHIFNIILQASASGREIGELVDASSRRAVESLRKQLNSDAKAGANAAERLAPAAGVWAREMLFLVRLSIRSFLTGYSEGKAEAETRDWTGIQKKIFEDAGVVMGDTNGADAATKSPPKAQSPPSVAKASRATVVAEAKPTGVSATLDGIEFVRKRKKPTSATTPTPADGNPAAEVDGSDVKPNDDKKSN